MKAPAFQLYAADFYMDTVGWSATEVGAYFRLLLHEWVNGSIPDNLMMMSRIAGVDHKTMGKFWSMSVGKKFIQNAEGEWENSRLEETRIEQLSYLEKLAKSGRIGGLHTQEQRRKEPSKASSKASSEIEALQSSSSLSINNNTIGKTKKKQFVPPTIEEITQYCKERKNQVNPQIWLDHYESNGWMVGKNKMNNWKAAVRTWEHRKFDDGGSYGRGKGNGDVGARVQPPVYDGDTDVPTEEERQRGLQRLAELKKLAGGIG